MSSRQSSGRRRFRPPSKRGSRMRSPVRRLVEIDRNRATSPLFHAEFGLRWKSYSDPDSLLHRARPLWLLVRHRSGHGNGSGRSGLRCDKARRWNGRLFMLLGFLGFTIASLLTLGHLSSPERMCIPTNSTRHPTRIPGKPAPTLSPAEQTRIVDALTHQAAGGG